MRTKKRAEKGAEAVGKSLPSEKHKGIGEKPPAEQREQVRSSAPSKAQKCGVCKSEKITHHKVYWCDRCLRFYYED